MLYYACMMGDVTELYIASAVFRLRIEPTETDQSLYRKFKKRNVVVTNSIFS